MAVDSKTIAVNLGFCQLNTLKRKCILNAPLPNNDGPISTLRGGSPRTRVCVCVSTYGNVWEPISINRIVWQRKRAGVEKLKRWAVPADALLRGH